MNSVRCGFDYISGKPSVIIGGHKYNLKNSSLSTTTLLEQTYQEIRPY